MQEEFKDTKGVIRIRISKKNRQHNGPQNSIKGQITLSITLLYKTLHRIVYANSLLLKCKLKETELCNFCNEIKETILHIFRECNIVKGLWLEMAEILKHKCNVYIPISAQHIILGSDGLDYSINLFIVLIKYYIYSCRFSGQKRCLSDVINILKRTYETEIQSVSFYQTPAIREMNCEEMGRY